MVAPNFIVIGAARCATTSLHKYLQSHSGVFLSEPKEINYFSKERFKSKGLQWYLSHFKNAKTKAIGEASTSYTSAPNVLDAPRHIKDELGSDIKFIYIVRDPIERLLSHYTHYVLRGQPIEPLEQIVREKKHSIVHQGRYAYQLSLFLEHFDKKNFKVITVDELKRHPQPTMQGICEFLGVSTEREFESGVHNNNTDFKDMTAFGKWLIGKYQYYFEHFPPPSTLTRALDKVARIGGKPFVKPSLSASQLDELRAFYQDDMRLFKEEWSIDFLREKQ